MLNRVQLNIRRSLYAQYVFRSVFLHHHSVDKALAAPTVKTGSLDWEANRPPSTGNMAVVTKLDLLLLEPD